MAETMADAQGIGLAAPQVHVPLRIVVFFVPSGRAEDPQASDGDPAGPVAANLPDQSRRSQPLDGATEEAGRPACRFPA